MNNLTTADLSKLLRDTMHNIVKGGHFALPQDKDLLNRIVDCPEEWGTPTKEVLDGARHWQNVKSILGVEGLMGVWAYHDFRDQVQEYQVKHGISATISKSITLRGKTLDYIDYNDQLVLLPDDFTVLKSQVAPICKLFNDTTADDYFLIEELDDETAAIATNEQIEFLSRICDHVWIRKHSSDWQDCGESFRSFPADRDPPDEITLSMHWGDPENPETSRYFKAMILDRLPCGREYYESLGE